MGQRGKPAKHDRMNGADPRTGQHSVGCFWNHGEIDRDAVALLDTMGFQRIGQATDLFMQLKIGDGLLLVRAVALPEDRGLVGTRRQVTVDAILATIERAVRVPANIHVTREACVLDPRVRLHPVQALSLLALKLFGFVQRLLVHSLVGRLVHQGGPVESVGDRIAICLRHHNSLPLLVNAML